MVVTAESALQRMLLPNVYSFWCRRQVLVYRNAYTFDDLEINGANSIIAINGSYVGMSTGVTSMISPAQL